MKDFLMDIFSYNMLLEAHSLVERYHNIESSYHIHYSLKRTQIHFIMLQIILLQFYLIKRTLVSSL